jgi:diguanylate cyclase (GGDEF)-like protein
MTLFITNAIIVFAFVACYLTVFVRYALSLENKIINESRTDELTQISNRYGLYDYYEEIDDKDEQAIALFDIDDFKFVNDHYGHAAGDLVLKRIAEIASDEVGDEFVCRYGGEEFVAVISGSVLEKLEALRKRIEKEEFEFEGEKIHVTVTIGVAYYSKDMSLEKWVECADEKMYFGKRNGKNKVISKIKKK